MEKEESAGQAAEVVHLSYRQRRVWENEVEAGLCEAGVRTSVVHQYASNRRVARESDLPDRQS